jgi:hypothetical protein
VKVNQFTKYSDQSAFALDEMFSQVKSQDIQLNLSTKIKRMTTVLVGYSAWLQNNHVVPCLRYGANLCEEMSGV